MIPDWSLEDDYLIKKVPLDEQVLFFKQKQDILNKYELEYPKYDLKTLSDYFKSYGFTLSEEDIKGWMIHNGETIKDEIVEGVIDLFDYLKSNNKDIVILTNWFSKTQIPRLKRTGLYDYVDKFVFGDDSMKSNIESFKLAIGNTNKEDCIMIGDSIKSDKLGAINAGIDYYIVDNENTIKDLLNLILKNDKILEKNKN